MKNAGMYVLGALTGWLVVALIWAILAYGWIVAIFAAPILIVGALAYLIYAGGRNAVFWHKNH